MNLLAQITTAPARRTLVSGTASPDGSSGDDRPVDTIGDVVTYVWDALGDNGYQTGVALIVATVAIVAMVNMGTHKVVTAVVALGAFWAGWLGYNTVTNEDNQLFPGEVSATKLWDIALSSDANFLLVVIVACLAAIFLWRKSVQTANRIVLMVSAILGASFLYNLYEAVRATSNA